VALGSFAVPEVGRVHVVIATVWFPGRLVGVSVEVVVGGVRSGKVLSERERARVRALGGEGLSVQEIAGVLGRSVGPVSAVLRGVYVVPGYLVSDLERDRIGRLAAEGRSGAAVARLVGRPETTVLRVLRLDHVAVGSGVWDPSAARLSLAEREEIGVGIARGWSLTAIGVGLGRATSTVSREVKANGGREGYRAWAAHNRARAAARRPKVAKLVACPALAAQVLAWLAEWWSPDEISRRLVMEYPDDTMMRVSHETIYQSLYVQGRGALRKELAACMRRGRATRRPRSRLEQRGSIVDKVMISQRPAEVADRAVPGHWEGDLIMGKDNRSAVGTLVERSTRYVLLLHLPPGNHGAEAVRVAMAGAMETLPESLRRSITWDQGSEMAQHAQFRVDTDVQIYFCDPHSPWQRGSNENTNGLLRQWMPKSTDLSVHSAADLAEIERKLNGRPRKTLGYFTPAEKLSELLAVPA
jgi:transposase, IS30 family